MELQRVFVERLLRGVPYRSLYVTRYYNSDAAEPGKIISELSLKVIEVYKLLVGMPRSRLCTLQGQESNSKGEYRRLIRISKDQWAGYQNTGISGVRRAISSRRSRQYRSNPT